MENFQMQVVMRVHGHNSMVTQGEPRQQLATQNNA